jgi:glycogen debranching enzyme
MDDVLVNDQVFMITTPAGDIEEGGPDGPRGLFHGDTRHLSRWVLTVDGVRPRVLTAGRGAHAFRPVLAPPATGGRSAPPYSVFRTQAVDSAGLAERLRVVNHLAEPVTVRLAYEVDADFADQFEVRSDREFAKPDGRRTRTGTPTGLELVYTRKDWVVRTVVTADPPPPEPGRLEWTVEVPAGGEAVVTLAAGGEIRDPERVAARAAAADAAFLGDAAATRTGDPDLDACVRQGLADLATLRVPAPTDPELRVPGAGVPWFLTLFGRDSLLTSYFALPYLPGLAAATLRALAVTQGTVTDPSRVEEPGKIVHETRSGELSHFGQVPYGRYYGTVDATPLFLVLLGAYREATGDGMLAAELEPAARAALGWVLRGLAGDGGPGYLTYRPDPAGLANQCWKDSPDSICAADGTPVTGAVAVCEAQGYAYDGLRRAAVLAREVWGDPAYADELERAAGALRDRFLADFWLPDEKFVAVALDGAGRPADALTSNPGHLLWSGLLDGDRGRAVGQRLADPEFFSGWGVRTLAAGQPPYHPISYHRGSVWPHDTAIAVAGMARYGLRDEAARVAEGLIAAGRGNGDRLPEVLTGFAREAATGTARSEPVPFPYSCSPQAWAAAAPLLIATHLR